jgi:hypothetical protein
MTVIFGYDKRFRRYFNLLACYASPLILFQQAAATRTFLQKYFNELVNLFPGKRPPFVSFMTGLSANLLLVTTAFFLRGRFRFYNIGGRGLGGSAGIFLQPGNDRFKFGYPRLKRLYHFRLFSDYFRLFLDEFL